MSLLQDERLVSSRLKKSEQIVNVKKMKQLLPTTFRIMSFSVTFVVFYKTLRILKRSFLSYSYNPTFRIMAF